MDGNLRREIILDNYQNPMNRGLVDDDSYLKVNTNKIFILMEKLVL